MGIFPQDGDRIAYLKFLKEKEDPKELKTLRRHLQKGRSSGNEPFLL